MFKDFKILQKYFPEIPVVIVLNKVDRLQNFPGHAFDFIATKQLPDDLKTSDELIAMQKRYQLLQANQSFLLSQMMLTSMRIEETNDRPVGLLGLYQATLNCMDDKQFDRLKKTTMTKEGNRYSSHIKNILIYLISVEDFLETVKEIKLRKKNSWGVVLICGSSNNGKSTLINNLFNKNVTQTGLDGTPTTTTLQIFPNETSKILYIDSAGLEKHDNKDKFVQLTSIRPDLIWLVLNYVSSIETTELDISEKYFPNTPLILIINKVDILQQLNINPIELNNFDKCVPDQLNQFQRLISVRNRLIEHQNAHRLVLLSLREDEENDKPIGLTNLLDITTQYFISRTSKKQRIFILYKILFIKMKLYYHHHSRTIYSHLNGHMIMD